MRTLKAITICSSKIGLSNPFSYSYQIVIFKQQPIEIKYWVHQNDLYYVYINSPLTKRMCPNEMQVNFENKSLI